MNTLNHSPGLDHAQKLSLHSTPSLGTGSFTPMEPMQPLSMGNMQMNLNSMEMKMGNMEMRLGDQLQPKNQFCSQCGAKVQPDARFCSTCGHKLS